ncbi:MAG TPA: phosphatidylglycerol lysyltransferase domain-containing protein, partial [Vicinamibacterales bacterium]
MDREGGRSPLHREPGGIPPAASRSHRLGPAASAALTLALFLVSLEVLRRELSSVTWRTFSSSVLSVPPSRLLAAVALTGLNYAALTMYDFIAFAYIGKTLSRWRVAGASFLAYAVANNIGFAMLSGASVRYRFYTRWGVTAEELSRVMFSYIITFWLGLLVLGGLSLAISPLAGLRTTLVAPVGWCLAGVSIAYIVATAVRGEPIRLGRFEVPLPSTRLALAQLTASVVDWALAGAVFYVLLPANGAPFFAVLGAFLAAQLVGLASHVPGGVGVFEGLMVLLLRPFFTSADLLPSLVAYRAVYYLLPLCVALVALVADEVWQRRTHVARMTAYFDRASEELMPRLLAVFAFVGGVVLLFSGATPAAVGRLALLNRLLPLGVIETSHIIGSLAGAALLLLSQGLARRLNTAYYLTASILAIGIASSLLKGGDVEEAVILSALLLVLHRSRSTFSRKAALFETRFSPAWIAAVTAAVAASVWLGLFAFKHVEYSHDLWWQFELDSEAPRFLRASVGAATLVLFAAVARLIGSAPHETPEPTDHELQEAAAIIAAQESTFPFLVFLRDKALLFNNDRTAFVMYAVQGRTWVALGDPVGPPECVPGLIREFLERCDDFGGTPVFYKVRKEYLHHYADFGLTFVKLGEEARVDLAKFTLAGGDAAKFRQVI